MLYLELPMTAATCIACMAGWMGAHCWAGAVGKRRRRRRQMQRLVLAGTGALSPAMVDGVSMRICGSCHDASKAMTAMVPWADPIAAAAVGPGKVGVVIAVIWPSAMLACCLGAVTPTRMRARAPRRQLPGDVGADR